MPDVVAVPDQALAVGKAVLERRVQGAAPLAAGGG